VKADAVGMELEPLRELLGARGSAEVSEEGEEARASGLGEDVVRIADRKVHRIKFPKRRCRMRHRVVLYPPGCEKARESAVAYVINEPCIGTKDNSCVEVCPVDCIHPTPDEPDYDAVEMLYIDPDECIDCDACVEACPVDAITPEDQVPAEWEKYIEINAAFYRERAA
jgi:NAD-dependent dihydropyrimidine dehydrogenase PreA subunit